MLERCCEERKTYADFLNTVVTANIHLYSDIGSVYPDPEKYKLEAISTAPGV